MSSTRPGYEIWFLVVFAHRLGRALWVRYTTFTPLADNARDRASATTWAAAWTAPDRPVSLRRRHAPDAFVARHADPTRVDLSVGGATLTNTSARGEIVSGDEGVSSGGGAGARAASRIAWDLSWEGAAPARPVLDRAAKKMPLAVRHLATHVPFRGWFEVDGARTELDPRDALGVVKHVWGRRRVEELAWLYVPAFDDARDVALEATTVRLRRGAPVVATAASAPHFVARALGARTELAAIDLDTERPALVLTASALRRGLRAVATCDKRSLVGWAYRDPAGWDVWVAQSDAASCRLELLERAHPLAPWRVLRTARTRCSGALELHGLEPLPGVDYLPW